MSIEVYHIKWNHFNVNQNYSLKDLFNKNSYSDVTLVSDDQSAFSAHKFVLSACSPLLKELLLNNPHPNPTVYLKGVKSLELNSILQFVYLGTTQFYHERMEKFFEAGRILELKQLSHPLIKEDKLIATTNHNRNDKQEDTLNEAFETQVENGRTDENSADLFIQEFINEDGRKCFSCQNCETVFNSRGGLSYHIDSRHLGKRYSCDLCGHKATTRRSLNEHKKSAHEGVRYSCNRCDYKATQLGVLKRHKEAIHEGVRYSCDSCDYKATKSDNLKKHKEAIHDGVRYSCDSFDYKATKLGILKQHQKSIHEGVRYSCDLCKFSTGWKQQLTKHKESKHNSQN